MLYLKLYLKYIMMLEKFILGSKNISSQVSQISFLNAQNKKNDHKVLKNSTSKYLKRHILNNHKKFCNS